MDAAEPPTVGGATSVGNLLRMVRSPFEFTAGLSGSGAVVRVPLPGDEQYYVTHPDAVRQLLVTDADRFEKPAFLADRLADLAPNLLHGLDGEQWRRVRDALEPLLSARAVRSYADVMVSTAARHAEQWTDGQRVDVFAAMRDLGLEVVARVLFGGEFRRLVAPARSLAAATGDRFGFPASLLPTWLPTPTNRRFRRAVTEFRTAVEDAVAARRSRADPGDDVLGRLVAAADDGALTDEELRDQVFTFLFGGHETVSFALGCAWYLLADSPDARGALRREADGLDGDPTAAELDGLDHAGRVARESLRLYPPNHELWRTASAAVDLAGYRVPAGATLVVPVFPVHRDGRFWDAPEAFRPDRWRRDDVPAAEYAYLPFGGGPRASLGSAFASQELRLVLATVARRCELRPTRDHPADLDLTASITPAPTGTVELRVRER